MQALQGDAVSFEAGTTAPVDAIIYATGNRWSFPFLDPALVPIRDGEAGLYRRVLSPAHPGLSFAGLVQPIGPTIPLVELQGRWLAGVLSGRIALPDAAAMRREIARHQAAASRRYVRSTRYTLEVDFRSYARSMARDAAAGAAGT